MALFTYEINANEFDLNDYPPLRVSSLSETFEAVPFKIDITFSYFSTLYYTNNRVRVVMEGKISQYKAKTLGWYTNYPSVALHLGGDVGGGGYAGLRVMIADCCVVSDFSGYVVENDVETALDTASYFSTFSGAYTSDGKFEVDECTLPIIFSDASQDELDNEYMFFNSSSVYGIPEILQFPNYSPTSSTDYLTKTLCKDHIINYLESAPKGADFWINVQWTTGTWSNDSQPQITGQPGFQGLRGKIVSGSLALYKIKGINAGKLKYGITSDAEFYDLQYSNDGYTWNDVVDNPYTFFYRRRENELGTFSYALSFATNRVPIFKNKDDAEDYIDGEKPIEDADNWDEISPFYPDPKVPGDPDSITEFGEVGARSIFSQQYVIPLSVLYEIANTFYDTTTAGLWDDIKKGLQMYGDSPIEAIENLSYYPLDLTQVFPGTSQNYIYFGGYKFDLTQGSVYKIANPNGFKTLGSVTFGRINNNWLDFEPYCKLFANIPYCGEYQLDLTEYYNKELSVQYFIDTRTGSCCCVLLADGHMVDKFNGQMGVQMPIKLTDFSAYANSQIQTLLGMGGQAVQNTSGIATQAMQGAAAGSGLAVAGAGALAAGAGGVIGAKTVYGLAQNNINRYTKTKGGSTSMLNMYMPQKVCFTFERNLPDIPANFYQLNGYPSNASGKIGNFSGYLKCDTVKLSMPGATDMEFEKARGLLLSGVFI